MANEFIARNGIIARSNSVITGSLSVSSSLSIGDIQPSATIGRLDASNDIVAFNSSDKRFKTNITPIENALEKVQKINGVEFDWIPDPVNHGYQGHDVGVIAQEIEEVVPELVRTRNSGYKAVKYDKIVALLIEAIKDLKKEIDELKKGK
jgi:hypothetical protein